MTLEPAVRGEHRVAFPQCLRYQRAIERVGLVPDQIAQQVAEAPGDRQGEGSHRSALRQERAILLVDRLPSSSNPLEGPVPEGRRDGKESRSRWQPGP